MKDKIESYLQSQKQIQKQLTEELKVYCKDESIPLEERFDLFIRSDLGKIEPFIPSEKEIREIIDEDLEYFERREIIYMSNLIEYMDDPTEENKRIVMKYALENFTQGFHYDW